ncbi:hypothetical protein ONZ45_g13420 [Pleurotus djamor]|nr:hypothetical protein ONZ45_g13420 [Pleurotus djamor]
MQLSQNTANTQILEAFDCFNRRFDALASLQAHCDEFVILYEEVQDQHKAQVKLDEIKQGSQPIEEYIAQFTALETASKFPKDTLVVFGPVARFPIKPLWLSGRKKQSLLKGIGNEEMTNQAESKIKPMLLLNHPQAEFPKGKVHKLLPDPNGAFPSPSVSSHIRNPSNFHPGFPKQQHYLQQTGVLFVPGILGPAINVDSWGTLLAFAHMDRGTLGLQ